jgi:hypothetical protein
MHGIKGFASKKIAQQIKSVKNIENNSDGKNGNRDEIHIFQSESFDRIIRSDLELLEKMTYIVNNPVKKEIIENGYEYKWYFLNDKNIKLII